MEACRGSVAPDQGLVSSCDRVCFAGWCAVERKCKEMTSAGLAVQVVGVADGAGTTKQRLAVRGLRSGLDHSYAPLCAVHAGPC